MEKINLQYAIAGAHFCAKEIYSINIEEDEHNTLYFNEYTYYIELNGRTPWLESYDIDTQKLFLGTGEVIENPNIMDLEVFKLDEEEHCKYILELEGYIVEPPKKEN